MKVNKNERKNKKKGSAQDMNVVYEKLNTYISNKEFTFNLNEQPTVQEFESAIGEKTILVAECKLNTHDNFPTKRKREYFNQKDNQYDGKKVDYKGLNSEWKDNTHEWLYFLAYDNRIVKLGMTITSLKSRYQSYSSGTSRAMKKGSCSTTNFIISECNTLAVSKGMSVKIYGIPVEKENATINRFGLEKECSYSIVREMETMLIESFKNCYSKKPVLCVQEGVW